jgi:hypothetical protein
MGVQLALSQGRRNTAWGSWKTGCVEVDEVTRKWKRLHNQRSSENIILVIKSRLGWYAGHVALQRKRKCTQGTWRKPERILISDWKTVFLSRTLHYASQIIGIERHFRTTYSRGSWTYDGMHASTVHGLLSIRNYCNDNYTFFFFNFKVILCS